MTPENRQDNASPREDALVEESEGRNEQEVSDPTDAPDDLNQKKLHERCEDTPGSSHSAKPIAKKIKRGKYISRAWCAIKSPSQNMSPPLHANYSSHLAHHANSEKSRSVFNPQKTPEDSSKCDKCEGGAPCAQCIAKKRPCFSAPRGSKSGHDQRAGFFSSGDSESLASADTSISSTQLLARLVEVERRLNMRASTNHDFHPKPNAFHTNTHQVTSDDHQSPANTDLQDVLEPDGQTFAGEISMTTAFKNANEDVEPARDLSINPHTTIASTPPLRQPTLPGETSTRKVRAWLENILEQHGVVANEEEWRRYMQTFMDEIHIMYPILHPPTIWGIFNEIWEYSALWPMTNATERELKRMSVALVCFCLALGRCSVSTRMTDANGIHSAGWSLYSVGISLMQDTVEMSNTASKSLITLQILVIRVLYLFRLDATQRAARLLALSISNAHIIGLHRQTTMESMPIFQSQFYCRAWWAIYVLDRRLAIESGRPYLIQDNNIDTSMPLELSDEWLSRYQSSTETTAEMQPQIIVETSGSPVTAMPYLTAMIRFSRVVGKAWELLYGVKSSGPSSSAMIEYADTVLFNLQESLPRDLSYDPKISPDLQFKNRWRWQVKQTMLLYICTTFLRLLMRRPFTSSIQPSQGPEDDELESVTICASLAARILGAHESIQEAALKYCFPFSHYLTSATMVMVGLVTKEPSLKKRYKAVTLAATRSLNMYCHSIWVSGKMMRYVSRLTSLAQKVLLANLPEENSQNLEDAQFDDMQQLTPQSDSIEVGQSARRKRGPDLAADIRTEGSRNILGFSRRDSVISRGSVYGSLPSSGIHGNPDADEASLWPMEADAQKPDFPDWAMSDFNFESVITDDGSKVSPLGLSTAPCDGISGQLRGCTMEIDRDMDQAIFGTIGPKSLFDLDTDMEQAILNLCSTGNPGFSL